MKRYSLVIGIIVAAVTCSNLLAQEKALLAIYLIAIGILTLTGLGIGIITGVLALLAGIFILIGR